MKITTQRQIKTRSNPSLRPVTTINLAQVAGVERGRGWGGSKKGIGEKQQPVTQPTINSVISTLNQPVTGNLLIDAHNVTHLSGFPIIFPNSDRTPLCFHRPTHPTETTLGVLFLKEYFSRRIETPSHDAQRQTFTMGKIVAVPHFNHDTVEFASREGSKHCFLF